MVAVTWGSGSGGDEVQVTSGVWFAAQVGMGLQVSHRRDWVLSPLVVLVSHCNSHNSTVAQSTLLACLLHVGYGRTK